MLVAGLLAGSPMAAADAIGQAGSASTAQAGRAATPYNMVPLSDDPLAFNVDMNAGGQVVFTELFQLPEPGAYPARF